MHFIRTISLFVCYLLTSCNNKSLNKSERAIESLTKQYTQLATNDSGRINEYKLERFVQEEHFKAELYTSALETRNAEKIIVITNGENKVYAIPYFDFEETEYWNMTAASYKKTTIHKPVSFENELKKCNKYLNITPRDNQFALYILRELLGYRESCINRQKIISLPLEVLFERDIKLWFTILEDGDFKIKTENYINID